MRAQLACTNATGAGELPQPIESRALQGRACFTARSMQWAVVDHAKYSVQVTSIDELHTLARASAPRSNLSGLLARQPLQLAVHITATQKLALRATKQSNEFFQFHGLLLVQWFAVQCVRLQQTLLRFHQQLLATLRMLVPTSLLYVAGSFCELFKFLLDCRLTLRCRCRVAQRA